MADLAAQEDVVNVLGRALTTSEEARVGHALSKASGMFRREAQREFTAGTSTVRLKVNGGRVYLSEPVASVSTVIGSDESPVPFTREGQWLVTELSSAQFVTVTYSHTGDVPDLVRDAVAEIAARALTTDDSARAGATQVQDTAGPFSRNRTFAAWAVGGQVLLSPDDKALARSYRPKVPTVWVMRP